MIPMTVTVAGFDGTSPDPDLTRIREEMWATLAPTHPGIRDRYSVDPAARSIIANAMMDHISGNPIAKAHRDAAPLANEYDTISAQALRAAEQADALYDDLSKNTTINWLAAHHRFVLATQRARDLLERRIEIAQDMQKHRMLLAQEPACLTYAKYVPAKHRIVLPDVDRTRLQLANFVEQATERFAVTRVTITGGYPAGFEPAPIEHEPFDRPADDEIVWKNATFPASVASVAGTRNW